jgi:hypothetical protein
MDNEDTTPVCYNWGKRPRRAEWSLVGYKKRKMTELKTAIQMTKTKPIIPSKPPNSAAAAVETPPLRP